MSSQAILFGLAFLFFLAAAFPFVLYAPSLRLMRHLGISAPARPVPGDTAEVRRFAVCVCAYNEEPVIRDKLENMLGLRRHTGLPVDLLLYVDAASDGTAAIARDFAPGVRVVEASARHGKSHGMNRLAALAAEAGADVLVFTDANVMVAPDALERLRRHFRDPSVGCVCGHLSYVNADASATAAVNGAYWAREEVIKRLEAETGGVIGADGSLFAVRTACHRPVPDDIIDDFYLPLAILCDGHRVTRADDVRAFEHTPTEGGEEFRRKVRIACQAWNVHRLLWPRLRRLHWTLRYKYVAHKLLRWLALGNALIGGLLAVAGVWAGAGAWAAAVLVGAAGLLMAAVGLTPHPLAERGREVLRALAATSLGLLRSLRGERFQVWAPPGGRVSQPGSADS